MQTRLRKDRCLLREPGGVEGAGPGLRTDQRLDVARALPIRQPPYIGLTRPMKLPIKGLEIPLSGLEW